MDAVWSGHLEVVKLLIDCGAKPNIRNQRKNTALHFAYEKGQTKIIEFLEEHGADKSLKWKNNLGPYLLRFRSILSLLLACFIG